MEKNLLVLSFSQRKNGNSDLLFDQFVMAAQQAGHHAARIRVQDNKINIHSAFRMFYKLNGERL